VRPVVKLQIVKLQIARHYVGAQKRGTSEARNENDDSEMQHPGIHTEYNRVSGRMREEGCSAAATPAARTKRSHCLALGEP
jgi:hypothetical protein